MWQQRPAVCKCAVNLDCVNSCSVPFYKWAPSITLLSVQCSTCNSIWSSRTRDNKSLTTVPQIPLWYFTIIIFFFEGLKRPNVYTCSKWQSLTLEKFGLMSSETRHYETLTVWPEEASNKQLVCFFWGGEFGLKNHLNVEDFAFRSKRNWNRNHEKPQPVGQWQWLLSFFTTL